MPGIGARRSLESQRDSSVSQLELDKRKRRSEILSATREQAAQLEAGVGMQIDQLSSQRASLQASLGELESVLGQLPAGDSRRGQVEKAIKARVKALAQIDMQINSLKLRLESQKRMINFRQNMQERMILIRFANQKSLLLRQFAERIMQMEQMQQQQAATVGPNVVNMGGGLKKRAEGTESGKLAG